MTCAWCDNPTERTWCDACRKQHPALFASDRDYLPGPKDPRQKHSDEQLLQMLRDEYNATGRLPTADPYAGRFKRPCNRTYQKRFGSLPKARTLAGLPERGGTDMAALEKTRHAGIYRRDLANGHTSYVVYWRHRGRQVKRTYRTLAEAREAKGRDGAKKLRG